MIQRAVGRLPEAFSWSHNRQLCGTVTDLGGHTQESAAREPWLWRADTSSPAWSPVGMISAPEGRESSRQRRVSLGVDWGQLGVRGWSGRGYVYQMLAFAILPGSQSELHPAPPSFPWKHGSKGKGYNSSQIHLHPLQRKVWNHGPYILQSAEAGLSHTYS